MTAAMTGGSAAADGRRPPLVLPALSAAAVVALLMMLLLGFGPGTLVWVPLTFLIAFAVTLAHTVLLGIPYALLLWKTGRLRLMPMLLGGFAAGYLPSALVLWPDTVTAPVTTPLATALTFVWPGALGALAAATFLLASRRLAAQARAPD